MEIRIKRVYAPPSPDDGLRVLVDRLWPRGVKKEIAAIDVWAKELAPSTELRKWFNHDEERFAEFAKRYRRELESSDVNLARSGISGSVLTLIYAARDPACNHAIVLMNCLMEQVVDRPQS